jgi:hypothetical protein
MLRRAVWRDLTDVSEVFIATIVRAVILDGRRKNLRYAGDFL